MRFFRARSSLDKKALLMALEEIDAIAIGTGAVEAEEEADLALHLAEGAFADKTNIARKLRYEFMLWLSGKRDIRSAMEATATKEGEGFFLAVFSDADEGDALEALDAIKLPLGLKKKADPLRLERISLSRIR